MNKTLVGLIGVALIPASVLAASGDDDSWREARMDRLQQRLELTHEQRARIAELFDEHRAEREAMRENMRARMAEVLTPQQQAEFEAMRDARREHRKAWRRGRRGMGGCDMGNMGPGGS